ncbi:13079_t:CDS:2 [Rhizophagus irregularis]|nr:13079_t:CDS:2 [Rhizophagus irregularis]
MTEKQDNKNRNNNKFQQFKSEVFKRNAWASIIYFIFWYPPWTILCLIWVLCTGLISVILLLVFLPLGYFVCIGTVMSWRTLARVELIALSFCVNPSYFLIDTIPEITRKAPLYPITKISPTKTETKFPLLGTEFFYNKYTGQCFYYFVLYKFFTLIAFIKLLPIFLIISLPPFTLFGLPITCKWSMKFGEKSPARIIWTFVIKRLKEEKKVRFKSTINPPSHDDISDGGAELVYFDAIDQNKKFEEVSTLNEEATGTALTTNEVTNRE